MSLYGLLSGCGSKEVVQPCYTCTSFVSYVSNAPTFNLSPYSRDKTVCDEAEKTTLEKGSSVTEPISGTLTFTRNTKTVCYKLPK